MTSSNYFDRCMFCHACGGKAVFTGTMGLTDHYACEDCGTEHALDFVAGALRLDRGDSVSQRFARALAKHKALIAPGGLP